MVIEANNISTARNEMGDAILRTPTIYSPGLSKLTGAEIFLKLENQQVTSSFKPRGAFTRMESLEKEICEIAKYQEIIETIGRNYSNKNST